MVTWRRLAGDPHCVEPALSEAEWVDFDVLAAGNARAVEHGITPSP